MDPIAGSLGSALVGLIYLLTSNAVSTGLVVSGHPVWKVALAIHVAAWILQFIGHGFFEGFLEIYNLSGNRIEIVFR